jgi:hypothetical protein
MCDPKIGRHKEVAIFAQTLEDINELLVVLQRAILSKLRDSQNYATHVIAAQTFPRSIGVNAPLSLDDRAVERLRPKSRSQ